MNPVKNAISENHRVLVKKSLGTHGGRPLTIFVNGEVRTRGSETRQWKTSLAFKEKGSASNNKANLLERPRFVPPGNNKRRKDSGCRSQW